MRTIIAAGLLAGVTLAAAPAALAQSLPGTGPYLGLNAGYGWGNSQQRDEVIPQPPPPVIDNEVPADGDYRVSGGFLGVTAGYGFLTGSLLLGVEGDINWSNIEGSSRVCGGDHTCGTRLDGFATLRGRIGTSIAASTLAYVTGGLAVGRIHAYDRLDPSFEGTKTKAGWTIGAGIEHKLDLKWSVKLEYLYMDFGRDEYFTITNRTPERVDLDVHAVRIGVNYHFDSPAPARYQPLK